jgi:hypothetical protein
LNGPLSPLRLAATGHPKKHFGYTRADGYTKMIDMDDPLSRALDEAPQIPRQPAPEGIDRHTVHPRAVNDILGAVRDQIVEALTLPFFDGGGGQDTSPVIKVGIAEAGNVHVSARHLDPPYRAEVTLYVRSDLESGTSGRYQIRARCEMACDAEQPALHRDFAVGVAIGDDGSVTIDVAQLRAEMADAIRSIGKRPTEG